MTRRWVLPTVSAILVAGLAVGVTTKSPNRASRLAADAPSEQAEDIGPVSHEKTNWDKALYDGREVALSSLQTLALPFAPKIPRFESPPSLVQVSTSLSTRFPAVGFAYTLAPSEVAGQDRRVIVVEALSDMPLAALKELAESSNSDHSAGRFIELSGVPAAVIEGNVDGVRVGRIIALSGRFTIDITGPSVSPAEVEVLMAKVLG